VAEPIIAGSNKTQEQWSKVKSELILKGFLKMILG